MVVVIQQISPGSDQPLASPEQPQQQELVQFLESHPEYYTLMKSDLCVKLLRSLSAKAKSINMLKQDFPQVDQEDLVLLVESMIEVKVVSFFDAGSNRFYHTNNNGKKFLEIYRSTKERFLGKENAGF